MKSIKRTLLPAAALAMGSILPATAWAEDTLDSGNTAWMLTSTALVLFMTLPGLALFYAGMVRSKNVLSVLMQCFAIAGVMSILWAIYGYSLAFSSAADAGVNQFIGGMGDFFLKSVKADSLSGSIPTSVFVTFQMTFFIITPALIVGGFAERMKFSSMLVFMALWGTIVYLPICHAVWGGGFMAEDGVLDFAGGTVVHINAGVAGLVAALVLGKRRGYPTTAMPPHNLSLTVTGAAMLWVGWFGFNAGSELAADGTAGMAMLVTQLAAATAAIVWMALEWMKHGKPSVLGIATGAVAGLVAITPASGTAGPMGGILIGLAAGFFAFIGATSIKRALGYDDSLDAFGVHGIAGIVGAILTGVFADASLGGSGLAEGKTIMSQVAVQTTSVGYTIVYCAVATFIILKVLDVIMGLRVDDEAEEMGLDLAEHDERGYNI
ncbi:ammonium transporter [Magnetococcus marinus MC-1]|uniref:Ammonium transporter n=1 Tax=Magnetococcus marinus (strain ATCC BAA-1437 / JCM 17883 / MC-1) TaxID=156889 RepID=A0L6B9_MAGMM|nr:ammonium transporter [Magnetococcus marinus]ABK43512.1 ammonium transporter [Magnetococcus marinus MC-1]